MSNHEKESNWETIGLPDAAVLIEKAEALILGGEPKSLVPDGERKPNLDLAEAILASAEHTIGDKKNHASLDAHVLVEKCAILKCQLAGLKSDYEAVLTASDEALQALEEMDSLMSKIAASGNARQRLHNKAHISSVLGYKGFALVKLGRHSNALPLLERSIRIRQEMANRKKNPPLDQKKRSSVTLQVRRERREALAAKQALMLCYQTLGVEPPPPPVVKFPRTAHLFDTGGTATTPDDLVVSDQEALMASICDGETRVIIEEKIDGANLGISLYHGKVLVQNRSHYISSAEHAQYNRITEWVAENQSALMHILCHNGTSGGEQRILYGEWVVARHSIPYKKLPGYFVAFDIYDENVGKFFSRARFHTAMEGTGIPVVPVIATETFGPYAGAHTKRLGSFYSALRSMLNTPSCFRDDGGFVEGIVLRVEKGDYQYTGVMPLWMEHRWKVVRPDFVGGCQEGHWSTRKIEKQRKDFDFAERYLNDCYVFADSNMKDPCPPTHSNSVEESNEVADLNSKNEKKVDATKISPSSGKKALLFHRKKGQQQFQAQLARARRRVPRCIVLMGLPSSGKTTFACRLAAADNKNEGSSPSSTWTIVNQDTMGKKECVVVAGKASRCSRIILDRCNLTKGERSEWLDIMHNPSPGEVALVYFCASANTCMERAAKRIGHETIPYGKGRSIIQDLTKCIEEPSEKERRDIFGTVELVRTFEESDELLRRWGVVNMV